MANAQGSLSAPANPAVAFYQQLASFLQTGNPAAPWSVPTAPQFRAGSNTSVTSVAAVNSVNLTIPATVQVGDLMVILVSSGGNYVSQPNGWSLLESNNSSYNTFLYRFAAASDAGSTIPLNLYSTYTGPWALSFAAYSGVNPYLPISTVVGTTVSSNSPPVAPAQTTQFANSLVVTGVVTYNATSDPTVTAGGTTRQTATAGIYYSSLTDTTQAAQGATTSPTFTTASAQWLTFGLVLNGLNAETGTPPAGGWTPVTTYIANNATAWSVWESPQASNNGGVSWYLVLSYQITAGGTGFAVDMCETYNVATNQWNACPYSVGGNTSYALPYAVSGSTTPAWAEVSPTPNVVGSRYSYQQSATTTLSTGTTNFLVAANSDGFFLSMLNAGVSDLNVYAGAFTSLVTNTTTLPSDSVTLGIVPFAKGQYPYYFGATRDPGISYLYNWGNYALAGFWPQYAVSYTQGTINGSMTNNDVYQSPPTTPIALRMAMYKQPYVTGGQGGSQASGSLRGLLPAWMQLILQSGCAWGDTVTEVQGGATPPTDTLTLVLPVNNLWVDTTAA